MLRAGRIRVSALPALLLLAVMLPFQNCGPGFQVNSATLSSENYPSSSDREPDLQNENQLPDPPEEQESDIPDATEINTDLPTSQEFAKSYKIFYVDKSNPKASDNNLGTETSPWKTIQKAANTLKPGEMVYVKAGSYDPFVVNVEGRENQDVVFSAAPGDEQLVIIDGTGYSGPRGLIYIRAKSHIQIHGFHVQNAPTDGIYVEGSASQESGVRIVGNKVEKTGNSGIYAAGLVMGSTIGVGEYRLLNLTIESNDVSHTNEPTGKNEAITLGGGVNGFIVRNNHVHDTRQYGIDCKLGCVNGVIYGNHIHDIEKHGIYLDSASRTLENIEVFGNKIHNATNGIVLARESEREPKEPNIRNVMIYNNLVYDNSKYGIMAYKHEWDVGTGDFRSVKILHNTVVKNGLDGIHFPASLSGIAEDFVVANNILYQNKPDFRNEINAHALSNLVGKDPLFQNPTEFDFHLRATSPALDNADSSNTTLMDFDGVSRPQGKAPDIGAFEYK